MIQTLGLLRLAKIKRHFRDEVTLNSEKIKPEYSYLHKNSQTVKKSAAYAKKASMKKVLKVKEVTQKWLWWSDNGRIFNNNNSGELCSLLQLGISTKIHPNC